ncbi:MAG TPA: nucleotidyl transferase AbiEii/AbiGii toxin family protein [Candidatus Elarobacter sp.]
MNTSAQAIKNRLLVIAKESEHPYNYVFERFTQERLLYRISRGPHADRFLLKGGLLLTAITERFARATHDIDFSADGSPEPQVMRQLVIDAIAVNVEPDGLSYEPNATTARVIKEHDHYSGVRLLVPGTFGKQQFEVQIDIGIGDKVVLPIAEFEYPTLIDGLPHPRMRAYSVESVIAEKLEAIASIGEINGRYKDFDDVVQLSRRSAFRASALHLACALTFETRETPLESLSPMISPAAATPERERHWQAYVRREHAVNRGRTFEEVLVELAAFASGVLDYANDGIQRTWNPGQRSWSKDVQ